MFMFILVLVTLLLILFFVTAINKGGQRASEEKKKLQEIGFFPTYTYSILRIDAKSRKWNTIYMGTELYSFDDVEECIIVEDGTKYKSDHGVMRAVVGGALFGLTGAVVGAVTSSRSQYINSMEVWIYTKNGQYHNNPLKVTIIKNQIQKGSPQYVTNKRIAEKIVNTLESQPLDNSDTAELTTDNSELATYKSYLDAGIITQAEFDEIKANSQSNV